MSKPTYEYLEAQVKQLEADNEKAMSVLKEANDAVLLAKSKFEALAAENAGLVKFIAQSCYVYNGDGSDISDAYTPAHESPMMPKQPNYLLPVAAECMALRDAFIRYLASENLSNKPYADERRVYAHCEKWVDAMCATPATDAFLAEVRNEAGARAVELFAKTLGSPYSFRDEICYEDGFARAIEVVRDIQAPRFAAQLRKGAAQ